MTELAALRPDAPLQDDAAYNVFLVHHPTPAACSCILCLSSSFDSLHAHLAYHTQRTRTRLIRRLQRGATTLPYIPHACLSIDAGWLDWVGAVKRSSWEVLKMRSDASDHLERQRMESAIQQLVNDRRQDQSSSEAMPAPFTPFRSLPSSESTALHQSQQPQDQQLSPFADLTDPTLSSNTPAGSSCTALSLPPTDTPQSSTFSPFADSYTDSDQPYFVIPTLSVRSSLCLYLQHRAFPPGSSVLLTAITIPDMLTVLNHFRLTPIPIDIPPDTLSPSPGSLHRHALPDTVAVLVAHLYGRQMDMSGLLGEARELGLEVWEDMAEGFRGYQPNPSVSSESASPYFAPFPLGSPQSDLVLFSFGAIKQLTAFGGGLLILPSRDQQTAEALLKLHHQLPKASASAYWQKCVKILVGMGLLNVPLLSGLVMSSARMAGVDHKSLVVALLRGFPSRLMHNLQHQPSLPLLQQLHHRLATASHSHLHTTVRGELFASLLPPNQLALPGFHSPSRHYWLFPMLPPVHLSTDVFLRELNRLGVDAYRGATQLAVVRGGGCVEAEELMDRVVYLPVHAGVPLRHLVRMAAIVQIVVNQKTDKVASQPLQSAL